MKRWLVLGAASPLLVAASAEAEPLDAARGHSTATSLRAPDLRLAPEIEVRRLPVEAGMLVRRDLSANTRIGLGVISVTRNSSLSEQGMRRSRKPAITFSWRF